MIIQWSQQEVIHIPDRTTKLCVLSGADPENKLLSVFDLFAAYNASGGFTLTKEAIEAVLTGEITSHTHPYLSAITKAMVEAVLTGIISSHGHDVSVIENAVSDADLAAHAADWTHLTLEQYNALNLLIEEGLLTQSQRDVLELWHVDINGNLVAETNVIVEGTVAAYDFGPSTLVNYDMLTDWGQYTPAMTDWVVAAPLLYDLYMDVEDIKAIIPTLVPETRQVFAGLGLSGGGTLENDITLTLDYSDLSIGTPELTDWMAFLKLDGIHYKALLSDFPYLPDTLRLNTPAYNTPEAVKGGGLAGGGLLIDELDLELDITNLAEKTANIAFTDYIAIYSIADGKHKKAKISALPIKNQLIIISLPAGATVAQRIAGATEGVDYPAGWVLAPGSSTVDLLVTHNSNGRVAGVSVFAVTNQEEQQLFDTAAYNGIKTPNVNSLIIQSLATINRAIKIYITFSWINT